CTRAAKKHFRRQAAEANVARLKLGTLIDSTPRYLKAVTGEIPVSAEKTAGTLPEISNNHDVRLVVSGACFEPCLPLAHVVGCSQVCVPVTPPDLQTTELLDKKKNDHHGDRVGAVHSRGAILQDVDVINHRKWNQINVHTAAEPDAVQ